MRLTAIAALVLSAVTFANAGSVIVAGAKWTDTSGNVIQAHGGGILKVSRILSACRNCEVEPYFISEREHLLLARRRQSAQQWIIPGCVLLLCMFNYVCIDHETYGNTWRIVNGSQQLDASARCIDSNPGNDDLDQ